MVCGAVISWPYQGTALSEASSVSSCSFFTSDSSGETYSALKELEKLAAAPERILFQEGAPPSAGPEENRKRLLQFGSQYENIHID